MRLFISILAVIILISCSDSSKELKRYSDTYYEILLARESFTDSVRANQEVANVLKKHGYTAEQFKKQSFEYFNDEPKTITTLIDSLRQRADREADSLRKLLRKNRDTTDRE